MDELLCLPTVFEFASLVDVNSKLFRVNRFWNSVAAESPLTVIDTVGYKIDLSILKNLIACNKTTLTEIRIGVPNCLMNETLDFFIKEDLPNLKKLEIYACSEDGAVYNVKESSFKTVGMTLVLQVDSPLVFELISKYQPSSISFLSGCGQIFGNLQELEIFLLCGVQLQTVHLGPCPFDVEDVLVRTCLFANNDQLRSFQWSGGSGSMSLEFMKTLIQHERIQFSFDSLPFMSWFILSL